MEEEMQRECAESGVTGSNIASALTQRRGEFFSESDVGNESDADGQSGRQMREVRGWEGAAMCTKGYCARRAAPH